MDFETTLTELQRRPKCNGWATKLQRFCEEYWKLLDSEVEQAIRDLDAFARLLEPQETFTLARLIIPDLRAQSGARLPNPRQQHIMERLAETRAVFADRSSSTQDAFDDELYKEEKDIFQDAELYRARILLYESHALEPARIEEIQAWLANRPGNKSSQQK
ncbi:hypothetical protein KC323_g8254 [Hortaea werneckii]|nr:hypothetical protein KC323_g8254 [Hortaea werneckii]